MSSTTRTSSPTRKGARLVVVVLLSLLAMAIAPGSASAASGTVRPIADCYRDNGDGTYTGVLGYVSDESVTRDIPVGPDNRTEPEAWQSQVPTRFEPGTHHGVASVVLTQRQLEGLDPASWSLDGTTLSAGTVGQVSACDGSEMPQLANGAVVVGSLAAAALVGLVLLRRNDRRNDRRSGARAAQSGV
ncbi:hypothetical protein SAMN03159343_0229 [Klenkia marina]|uniref:MYXO-CTERM domain-containing protein n=1 Tax=Klenkia marina TaxID=1960309 RepID=A0A1G4X9H9_9ACTN|nr:hypothetical protein [Klenkia marina]SCX37880.1 hypothetical protein SAMN03159343_0229 [Klenkia marina]